MNDEDYRDRLYVIDETGQRKEITQKEAFNALRKAKPKLIAKLTTCIDNDYPFLLITSNSKSINMARLDVVTPVTSKDFSHILGVIFLELPLFTARAVLHELSDMMIYRVIEKYLEGRLKGGWLNEE